MKGRSTTTNLLEFVIQKISFMAVREIVFDKLSNEILHFKLFRFGLNENFVSESSLFPIAHI